MRDASDMAPTIDQTVTSKQACTRLGIDRSTLTRWVADGRLTPAFKFPSKAGAFLFAPEDIDALEAAMNATAK